MLINHLSYRLGKSSANELGFSLHIKHTDDTQITIQSLLGETYRYDFRDLHYITTRDINSAARSIPQIYKSSHFCYLQNDTALMEAYLIHYINCNDILIIITLSALTEVLEMRIL